MSREKWLTNLIDKANATIDKLNKTISVLKRDRNSLLEELEKERMENNRLMKEIEYLRKENEQIKKDNIVKDTMLKEVMKKVEECSSNIEEKKLYYSAKELEHKLDVIA